MLTPTILNLSDINFSEKAGDASLVLRRASAFFNAAGVHTLFVVFDKTCMPVDVKAWREHGIDFLLLPVRDTRQRILQLLRELDIRIVLFTFPNTYRFVRIISRHRHRTGIPIQLFIDAHGALHEITDYASGGWSAIRSRLSFVKSLLRLNWATIWVDGALCVTNELKQYYRRYAPLTRRADFRFIRINCGVKDSIDAAQLLSWRKEIRNELGITNRHRVFVFCGIQRPWHCFEEVVMWFSWLDARYPDLFFAFYTNLDVDDAEDLSRRFPRGNCVVKFLAQDELIPYLAACDVGVILRYGNWTNYVAFPNKFSEYLCAGLIIALSSSLREPMTLLQRHQLPHLELDYRALTAPVDFTTIEARRANLEGYYRLSAQFCDSELDYTRQVRVAARILGLSTSAKKCRISSPTLLSVIVPVYNVAPYLPQCIDSLLEQRYNNLEIILVDDGSTDESPAICDAYAKSDRRIRTVHQANGGLSTARNTGLALATGDYIGFVDSDDWVANDMYERLMAAIAATGAEIAECGVTAVSPDGSSYPFNITEETCFSTEEALKELILEKRVKQTVWNKVYRADLARKTCFEVGRVSEDSFWTYQVFSMARAVVQIGVSGYFYRQRADSIMSQYRLQHLDALAAHRQRSDYLRQCYPALTELSERQWFLASLFHYHRLSSLAELDADGMHRRSIAASVRAACWPLLLNRTLGKYRLWLLLFALSPSLWYKIEQLRHF
jgi:glycosyltransferase involved in cell wall biosynthesis